MSIQLLRNINIEHFQQDILDWYEKNKRQLPWREDNDPYKVWVSEIMLQQTKVDTVIPYFMAFMEKYPTVFDLARAQEQEVLKAWEGLGYYSRARNLHTAAKEVVEKYDGIIPDDPDIFGSLKGVGPYTKGAVMSIAFNQPEPAVDGNFTRVFSRVLKVEEDIAKAKTKKLFEMYMYELISKEDPSSFNQAVMDLGATICTPKSPMCMFCPVQEHCQAFQEGVEEQLPIKSKQKKQKVHRYVALLIVNPKGEVLIEQRPEDGLLANMWQFPMVDLQDVRVEHVEDWIRKEWGIIVSLKEKKGKIKHVFTHLKWELDVYVATIELTEVNDDFTFVSKETLDDYPFPVPHQKMKKFLE